MAIYTITVDSYIIYSYNLVMLKDIIKDKNISVYKLAKGSGVPYTTVNEIVLGKKNPKDCSVKTISSLANYLNVPEQALFDDSKIKISTSWLDQKDKKYIFPIIEKNDNYDVSRIHPLNQKKVDTIFNIVNGDSRINKLIVFGSSTTIRCNKDSDVDIYISLNTKDINNKNKDEISEAIQNKLDYKADIIWADRVSNNSKLYKNIMKGEIIYE